MFSPIHPFSHGIDLRVRGAADASLNRFGQRPKTMILQEFIQWEDYIRCICIGREHINPVRYEPNAPFHERYVVDRPLDATLPPSQHTLTAPAPDKGRRHAQEIEAVLPRLAPTIARAERFASR